jgi:pimeloyl-ACP methyl ester carboxylesterase
MAEALLVLVALVLAVLAWRLVRLDLPRATLVARYAAPPSTFRTVAGVTLHLRDEGPRDAPAVLLLHGFGVSLHLWDDWARLLAPRFRVIRPDLPGFGLTGPDPGGDYSDDRTIAVLAALLDDLGIARAHVIGSSMGGRYAWRFAADHPGRVDRLVLMAPDGFSERGKDGRPARIPWYFRLLPWMLPERPLRKISAAGYADPAALTDAIFTRTHDLLRAPGVRRAMLQRMAAMTRTDPTPILARITAPTLLLWGDTDRMIPHTHAADYARAIPHAQTVVLPALGHAPMEEAPEVSLAPVLAFLSRAPSAA